MEKFRAGFTVLLFISTAISTLSEQDFHRTINENFQTAKQAMAGRFLDLPLAQNWDELNNIYDRRQRVPSGATFDFIIVGSGAAGSVLANRLSENPEWRVLLLEAGDEASPITDIPFLAPKFQFSELNWNYSMEHQDNVGLGLVNQQVPWPRGRGIGGSSLINYMIYTRGNRRDYDRWARLGNPGWKYRDVFRYFTRSEDCKVAVQDDGYHGIGSYLSIEDVPFRTESAKAFVEAAEESGYSYVDYNGKRQLGVSFVQGTTKKSRRWSAEAAFLRDFTNRTNLRVLPKSRVLKILITNDTKQAYGVEYLRNGRSHVVFAMNEVILSAGTFHSPQLLMLSGIGPQEHLKKLGIPVLQDLPVGKKLYDHTFFIGLVFTANQPIVNNFARSMELSSFINYIADGTGPLTSTVSVEALLFMNTNTSKEVKNYPDIELIFFSSSMASDRGQLFKKTFGVNDEVYNTVFKPLEGKNTFQIVPMLLHPKSWGFVELRSKNPLDPPKLHGRYFTDPGNQDINTFLAGIREAQRLAKAPAFQKYGVQMVSTPIPGCTTYLWDSDEYWQCALRHLTLSAHHQIATCKMGPKTDPEAVVDARLRVPGIKNLRVVDTSIIPIPLSAHTNGPAFMIGEKAADLIKEDHKV